MQLPTDFLTWDYLGTFAGMVMAIVLLVQFTKDVIKTVFSDQIVRLYTFGWALVFVIVTTWMKGAFAATIEGIIQQALLCLINAIIVTLAAMGTYEAIVDPKATKAAIPVATTSVTAYSGVAQKTDISGQTPD